MLLTVHMVAVWWCVVGTGSCVRDGNEIYDISS